MAICQAPATGSAFTVALLDFIDCQARTLGAGGYQALASPSSSVSLALTSLLTIFVALFGVRLLLGHAIELRGAVLAVVKIGVVLLIATSWQAVRTLVYDLTMDGPQQLVAEMIGDGAPLSARLQAVDTNVAVLSSYGTGRAELSVSAAPARGQPITPGSPLLDDVGFGAGRIAFVVGAVGTLGAIRLTAGILLALAPLFAGLLLFEVTRGVFSGWLRALGAALVGGIAVTLILTIEAAVLGSWAAGAIAERVARVPTLSVPIELLAITFGFALLLVTSLYLVARVFFTIHMPSLAAALPSSLTSASAAGAAGAAGGIVPADRALRQAVPATTSRAAAVADSIAMTQRREERLTTSSTPGLAASAGDSIGVQQSDPRVRQGGGRRTTTRRSAVAQRRDAR